MSISLRAMSKEQRRTAIQRRLKQSESNRGLGYWAAIDANKKAVK